MKRIAIVIAFTLLAGPALAEDAKTLYSQKCAACHGPDGKAKRMGSPDISAVKATEGDIEKVIANGKGKMQPYKDKLTAEQIKDVATYVKSGLK
jgi:mono/diheme cytochrome c family protein